jgi:hypothetical protein
MKIVYEDNIRDYINQLNRAGIAIQEAGAEALNKAGKFIIVQYGRQLQKKTRLRQKKFTLGATVLLQAHAKHSDKKRLRELKDVNAIAGVRSFSNGKEHYLAAMELGIDRKGSAKTGGKVPIPLYPARGGNIERTVETKHRLTKTRPIPLDMRKSANARQQYAILRSMAKRGDITKGTYQTEDGIYAVSKNEVTKTRKADQETVKVKSLPLFSESVYQLDENTMNRFFIFACKMLLSHL